MIWVSNEYYFARLAESELLELLRFYVLEIYNHYHYTDYTLKSTNEEMANLLKEDKSYFTNSVFYVLRGCKEHRIHGAIRLTYWDKKVELPIEKLFGINVSRLFLPGVNNFWHIGRFVISSNISTDRVSLLKKTLFNAFYPVYTMKSGIIIAECDLKVAITLRKMGIDSFILGESKDYICSETVPLYIKSEWLNVFIHSNICRYLSEENIDDVNFFSQLANQSNGLVN